jgi:hypothetical protein
MKHWSSTQPSTALSSGEAEFGGVVRGSGQGLGYQALLKDLGVDVPLRVWTDSSAAIGICSRQGLGKLRHLDTHTLWVQQAVRTGRVDLRKVDGDVNPADLLTKHSLSRDRLLKLVELFNCKYIGGRAASAPQLRRGASSKTTLADAEELNAADRPSVRTTSTAAAAADTETEEPQASVCEYSPIMPHTLYQQEELDRLFPALTAPDAECLDDGHERAAEAQDAVLQHGLRLADQIQEDMVANGRRRRPSEPARSAAQTAPTDGRPPARPPTDRPPPSVRTKATTSTSSPSSTGPDIPMRRADSKSSRIAGGVRKSGVLLASTSTSTSTVARKSLRHVSGPSFVSSFGTCVNGLALAQAKLHAQQ